MNICTAIIASLALLSGLPLFARAQKITFGPPPMNITYTCVVETWAGPASVHKTLKTRLFYDRGKFREEILDPGTGKIVRWKVYNRDGQGLSFYSWGLSPPSAGVDLDGVFYRLARDNPKGYFRMSGTPKEWGLLYPSRSRFTASNGFQVTAAPE